MNIVRTMGLAGLLLLGADCQGQPVRLPSGPAEPVVAVGGPFENGDWMYKGRPARIAATDTSPGWKQPGPRILLTGTVYRADGRTPAPNVEMYYYHTNRAGRYAPKPGEARNMPPNASGQTHGYIRGWVRTDARGQYFIYTVRPGTYPTRDEPAHVHVTIKEPNRLKEYYIDEFVFDDDPLLTADRRKKMDNRGGSGVVRLVSKEDIQVGERDIMLGRNIPHYPGATPPGRKIGNRVGEDVFSFTPYHAWGPDKGTRTCPICKYGWYHGILYFVGNNPNWGEIRQWLTFLETESGRRGNYLKAYFVYGNETEYNKARREAELESLGRTLHLKQVALTFVPSFTDTNSDIHLNRISQTATNTFILYRRSRIIDQFVNVKPTDANFQRLRKRLEQTVGPYFDLPPPRYN